MINLYLARHGQTEMNKKKVYYGWLDVPIDEDGLKQCKQVAEKLSEIEFDVVISSTLKRAYTSANIICRNLDTGKIEINNEGPLQKSEAPSNVAGLHKDKKILKYEELKEINFGKWEGMHYTEVKESYCEAWAFWAKDWINYCIPEGESFLRFYKRVEACFHKILLENQDKTILLVAHEGTLRIIATILLKMKIEDYWSFHFEYGKYSNFEIYPELTVIKKINC
jgi:alpha-ribazole phosphatase